MAGEKLADVGVETDKTVAAKEFLINGLRFVDLPGYGTSQFPKAGYAQRFKINEFDLFLCVTSGKLHQADTEFFQELTQRGKVCLFVLNKHDELWEEGVDTPTLEARKRADIAKHVGHAVPTVFTSCRRKTGLDALQTLISEHLDAAKRERWVRGAKAYSSAFLAQKRAACEGYVTTAALASAANGINPVPGVDVAVDVSVLMKLFKEIRNSYGLSDAALGTLQRSTAPVVAQLANNVLKYAAREGLLMLLKRYAGRQAIKALAKYIPFVGQAVAAGLGYAITSNAGASYLDDCHTLAEQMLNQKLAG
jgi:GTP-binding protein EngB required for normal cell division/uncharacterized protein (DUF697 family)